MHGVIESSPRSLPNRVTAARPVGAGVVFTFSVEMIEDAVGREFCRPPDQTLLAPARDARVGRLLVADSRRSYLAYVCSAPSIASS